MVITCSSCNRSFGRSTPSTFTSEFVSFPNFLAILASWSFTCWVNCDLTFYISFLKTSNTDLLNITIRISVISDDCSNHLSICLVGGKLVGISMKFTLCKWQRRALPAGQVGSHLPHPCIIPCWWVGMRCSWPSKHRWLSWMHSLLSQSWGTSLSYFPIL